MEKSAWYTLMHALPISLNVMVTFITLHFLRGMCHDQVQVLASVCALVDPHKPDQKNPSMDCWVWLVRLDNHHRIM